MMRDQRFAHVHQRWHDCPTEQRVDDLLAGTAYRVNTNAEDSFEIVGTDVQGATLEDVARTLWEHAIQIDELDAQCGSPA